MFGEIIAIGDELISGKVLNTTSTFAAKKLFSAGYPIRRITSIGDDPRDIEECLIQAIGRSYFVLVTGGLGPTDDDITNEVVAKALGRPLVANQTVMALFERAKAYGHRHSDKFMKKLAMMPEGAEFLNPKGHAAGYLLVHEGIPLFFLPGVPDQLEDHVVNQVIPRLKRLIDKGLTIRQKTFKVFGLQETEINDLVDQIEVGSQGIIIGYYPNFPEVHVTVTVKGEQSPEVEASFYGMCQRLQELLGQQVVAQDDETLEEVTGQLLMDKNGMLALAESCTGGLIAHRVTRIPGSSQWFERGVVTYSNQAKQDILGVPKQVLSQHGAVSSQTAIAMVEGVRKISGVQYTLAVTGIAGPTGGLPDKPVGTVYIALSAPEGTKVHRFLFPGDRHMIQDLTAETALDWLRRHLSFGPEAGPVERYRKD